MRAQLERHLAPADVNVRMMVLGFGELRDLIDELDPGEITRKTELTRDFVSLSRPRGHSSKSGDEGIFSEEFGHA